MKDKVEEAISSIRELVKTYTWLQVVLGSFVAVLGGSSFITFLNKYAIYNYAVAYGGRLPAEGVPYIDIAISILSFAFLAVSLICALMIYGLLTIVRSRGQST